MKKLVLLLLVSVYSLRPMESPKLDQQSTRGMANLRSMATFIAANHMCQPTITPIAAEALASALGACSNLHDKYHYLKTLQFVASLLHQEDELLQIIDCYHEALTLRSLINELITCSQHSTESEKMADIDSSEIQREPFERLAQLSIAFIRKDDSAIAAACHAMVGALTTTPHAFLSPTLEDIQKHLSTIIKNSFDQTLDVVKVFFLNFDEIKLLKPYHGYFYPFMQTIIGAATVMGTTESVSELGDWTHDTENISEIAAALDITELHAWHEHNKTTIHQFYNLVLKELGKSRFTESYGKNLFGDKKLLTPIADGPIASTEKEPTLTEAERDDFAMKFIAELDANKKALQENHTSKKWRKRSSPTDESSSSSSSSSSSRDDTPKLDSDSEVEEAITTEFDPESAFVKSALASHKEKSNSPAASSPAASSSSASSSSACPFAYKDRTTVWQKRLCSAIAEMVKRNHTAPYAQFHDLAYHRLPFVLEHVFKDSAQHTFYTSPKTNRQYDVLCFDGAIIVNRQTFQEELIAEKTVYGTFEISCIPNTTFVVHRCFKPYDTKLTVIKRPIDTHGKIRTETCMGHRYTITENTQNILIQEPRSPVNNVTYVIFKPIIS